MALNQKVLEVVERAPEINETIRRLDATAERLEHMLQVDGLSLQEWAAGQNDRWREHDYERTKFRDMLRDEMRDMEQRIEQSIRSTHPPQPRRRSFLDWFLGSDG